jgi:ubiquinone/menaquinone biosynthesis C-methylase UbiE
MVAKYSPLTENFSVMSEFDWGSVSEQYAHFRPPPPSSFFKKLKALDVGIPGQNILDIGTGVGHLARIFAKKKCSITGVDISSNQIDYAKKLALQEQLSIDFKNIAAEEIEFPKNYFDVAIAMQSWAYFKADLLCQKLKLVLKPAGLLMIGNFDHLPQQDVIAKETENLMLQYNNKWRGANFDGYVPALPKEFADRFILKAMFFYDELIPFARTSWVGRIIASQAIGLSLSKEAIAEFKKDMIKMLCKQSKNRFAVLHRLSAHILQFK